jgi:hypothetical protein
LTENKNDPLLQAPEAEVALFRAFAQAANGFSHEQVAGAAVNIIVNVLRQKNAGRMGALSDVDNIHASMRQIIDAHYNNAGSRRNVFPFHQVIEVPNLDLRKS